MLRLLYRGTKYRNESLMDYIQRISEKNGYLNFKKFEKMIIKNFNEGFFYYEHNLSFYGIRRLALEKALLRNISLDYSYIVGNTVRSIWLSKPRFCNKCFEIYGYVPFYWRLKDYQFCHLHNEALCCEKMSDNLSIGSDFHENYATKAVKLYANSYDSQKLIISEVNTVFNEQQIIYSLVQVFSDDGKVLKKLYTAGMRSLIGENAGASSQTRIYKLAENIACNLEEVEIFVRLICLLLINPKKNGLHCRFIKGLSFYELYSYARFRVGTDTAFKKMYKDTPKTLQRSDFKADKVRLILGTYYSNNYLREMVRLAAFNSRVIKSWSNPDATLGNLVDQFRGIRGAELHQRREV